MKEQKHPLEEELEKRLFPKPPSMDQFDLIETRPLSEMDSEVRQKCEELNELLKDILAPDPSFISQMNEEDED